MQDIIMTLAIATAVAFILAAVALTLDYRRWTKKQRS
jgi:hypothetical protein